MTLREHIKEGILLLDGAMGTQLTARGAKGNNELWGVEHPDVLAEVHRAYVDAGAQAVITDTFGGNSAKLAKAGLGDRADELNRRLVEIAREAVRGRAWVLADVGPTGQFVEPYGDLTEAQMTDVFRRQIAVLLEAGADGIIIETMMDVTEAVCAVNAARSLAAGIPVLVTMTFDVNPRGFRTLMGVSPAQAASRLAETGPDAVGANCGGLLPVQYAALCSEMSAATSLPIIAEPNAGLPELEDGVTVFKEPPETFGAIVPDLIASGVKVMGGCCGTGPAHIQAMSNALKMIKK